MTPQQLHQHKLDRARKQGDIAALAILEGDRTYTPDPETPMLSIRLCGVSAPHRQPFVRLGTAA
jgi:hypothetical protein